MAGNVKTNSVQLGDSTTATQNFVLQTNVDGTAKLARGNVGATTQDILTVDANGRVAMPQSVVAFNAYKSGANQTVVSGTPTLVTFQTEVFDVGGYFNLGTGRFTPLVAGYYQVNASVYGSASPISTVAGAIYRNGVSIAQVSVNGTIAILPITALVYMNGTTDYLELFGTITGTTPVIGFGVQGSTSFSAVLVGAA